MRIPKSVQHFLDEHQWKNSKIPARYIPDSGEFKKVALDEGFPTYIVRSWIVAHLSNQIVFTDMKGFTYDGVVSTRNETEYLACGLFQEPVSLLHRLIKSGKTVTLSYRYSLNTTKMLSGNNIKYKELKKPLKFLVEITNRRCRICVFVKEVENNGSRKETGRGSNDRRG